MTSAIGQSRRFVREAVAGAVDYSGDHDDLRSDLELSVSELVSNAVEHGLDGPILVRVAITPDAVVVSVQSTRTSTEIADPSTWAGPLPAIRTGRGLAIVRAISDDVSVVADGATVTVSCTFRTG